MLRQSKNKEEDVTSPDYERVELNKFQRQALQNIRAKQVGLTEAHFRGCEWFNSVEYVEALSIALFNHPERSIERIIKKLQQHTPLQLRALLSGFNESDIRILNSVQLNIFITLSTSRAVSLQGLPRGFNLAIHLRERSWLIHDEHVTVLKNMVDLYGYPPMQSIDLLQGLNIYQLQVLCSGMEYGIKPEDLHSRHWIDSKEKVDALLAIVSCRDTHSVFALGEKVEYEWQWQELAKYKGMFSEDILQLQHPEQWRAVEQLRHFGLQSRDLSGQDWFNSSYHYLILHQLITHKCQNVHAAIRHELIKQRSEFDKEYAGKSDEEMACIDARCKQMDSDYVRIEEGRKRAAVLESINAISGTTPLQARVMFSRKYSEKSQVIKLNEFQARAMLEIDYPRLAYRDVVDQRWLCSEERLNVFRYLLKDSRLMHLADSRAVYRIVCAGLASWSDEDFARVSDQPAVRGNNYEIPEVSQLIADYRQEAARQAEQSSKCAIQ